LTYFIDNFIENTQKKNHQYWLKNKTLHMQKKPILAPFGSLVYNYLYSVYIVSPLKLWVWTPFMAPCTRCNIMCSSLSLIYDRSVVFSRYTGFLHQ
jgi:hypothetical protein